MYMYGNLSTRKNDGHMRPAHIFPTRRSSVVIIEIQVILNTYLKCLQCILYFEFCSIDKINLYHVIKLQVVCILCNWTTLLNQIQKLIENNTSACCFPFNGIPHIGIVFQLVF